MFVLSYHGHLAPDTVNKCVAVAVAVCCCQVPGAIMMGPYKAPKDGDEIIGYEVYFPRVSYPDLSYHSACCPTK